MLLEIIATSIQDALAAERGGADRVEVCAEIERDGLTPPPRLVAEIRAAVSIEVRAMLRPEDCFTLAGDERERLLEEAEALVGAGADGFVVGYLDEKGDPDLAAIEEVAPTFGGRPWTFHRAIDHSRDPVATLEAIVGLTGLGCDTVLAAGSPKGVEAGLSTLSSLADMQSADDWRGPILMAGGDLQMQQVPALASHGVRRFHIGEGVRLDDDWGSPVEADRVASWRELIDEQPPS